MTESFGPGSAPLRGEAHVPGDKSMSHRAVLFSAMAEGTTTLHGVLNSADVRATIHAVSDLGAHVEFQTEDDGSLSGTVRGWGHSCPLPWSGTIDCGNSGTTARLLMGVLAGWPAEVTLTGDESLSRRPMRRVAEPLTAMGATYTLSEDGTLPVIVHGRASIKPAHYASPVASAQVKTAVLLAGLRAQGRTSVSEPSLSRDHTERMLPSFGVPVEVDPATHTAVVVGPVIPVARDLFVVPRDPSSAAFLTVAALLVPGSKIEMPGVSLNPTRTGFLSVIERMGSGVEVVPWPETEGERVGTIVACTARSLSATTVTSDEIPSLIDELPILALLATQVAGETRFEDVGELRVKESDRLAAIIDGLTALGGDARAEGDTLIVTGPTPLGGATLESLGDHRLAMTWAVAGLIASAPVVVEGFEAIDVSYPSFAEDIARLVTK